MVVEVIWGLQMRRFEPVVLTRGYGRLTKRPVFLDREKLHFIDTGESFELSELSSEEIVNCVGDEALEVFVKTGVRILVGANRHKNAMWFLSAQGGSISDLVFILDDGFQHWKMERDFDIVLYNKKDLEDDLLPLGRLREKKSALERADLALMIGFDVEKETLFPEGLMDEPPAIIVTRAPDVSYKEVLEERYGKGLRYIELGDHASSAILRDKINRTIQRHIVLGYKEAVKVLPWSMLAEHQGRPFVRDDIFEGKHIWVLGLRMKLNDEANVWTHLEHMLEMKYLGAHSEFEEI